MGYLTINPDPTQQRPVYLIAEERALGLDDDRWNALCAEKDYSDFWLGDEEDGDVVEDSTSRFELVEQLLLQAQEILGDSDDPNLASPELHDIELVNTSDKYNYDLIVCVQVPYGPKVVSDRIRFGVLHRADDDDSTATGKVRARYALGEVLQCRNRLLDGLAEYVEQGSNELPFTDRQGERYGWHQVTDDDGRRWDRHGTPL